MLNITIGSLIDGVQPVVNRGITLKDCIDSMKRYNKGYVVILEKDTAVGIITERDIIRILEERPSIDTDCFEYATKQIISITADKNIYFALNIMIDNNIRRIIVNDSFGKFLGSLTLKELMFKIEEDAFKREIKIKELINSREVIYVYKDDTLIDTINIMKKNNIGSVVVFDRETGSLVGIVTERDFVNHFIDFDPQKPVEEIMSKNPLTIETDKTVYEAIQIMEANKISRLIVMENNKVVGILNYRDVVKLFEEKRKLILENKLKHARELLDLMPDMMIEVSDELDQQNIIWANKRAKNEFGNIIGKSILSVIPKDYWTLIHSKLLIEKTVEKIKFEREGKVYQISGTYLLTDTTFEKGRIKFIVSDITSQESKILHIDKELKTYKKIINHADDMIIIYEADSGKIKLFNDAVIKKLGYTTDELENITIFDIVDEDESIIRKNIQQIVRKNIPIKGRRFYKEVYGEKIPVEIVASKVDFNSVPHILIVARDISTRVKLEDELSRKNQELKDLTDFILNLNKAVSEEEAYDLLAHMLLNKIGVDGLLVYRVNPSLNRVTDILRYGKATTDDQVCIDENLNQCKVIITNQPFIKIGKDSFSCPFYKIEENYSYACMNIMSAGKVIAVVNMLAKSEEIFNEEKIKFIQKVINSFSPFVSNLRLLNLTKELSIKDPLSGLYNRRFVYEFFDKKTQESHRKGEKIGVLIMDIDNFKKLNDTYGHNLGDFVIKKVSETILKSIRSMDVAGRWGGEEFIVIIPSIHTRELVVNIAERIRRNVESQKVYTDEGKFVGVTVSIGISIFPDDGEDLDTVIKKADEKLYIAKNSGKNTVIF